MSVALSPLSTVMSTLLFEAPVLCAADAGIAEPLPVSTSPGVR